MIAFIHYPRRECSKQVSVTLEQKDKSLHQNPIFPLEQRAGMTKVFHKEYGFTGWRDTLEVKSIGLFFQKKEFKSQYLHGSSQPSVNPIQVYLTPRSNHC